MRILQLIHKNQRRGAEVFTGELTKRLREQGGIKVDVCSVYESSGNALGMEIESLNAHQGLLPERKAVRILRDKLKEYDIVQANSGDTLKYAAFAKLRSSRKIPLVFRNASTVSNYLRNPVQRIFNNFLYRQVDAVASVSEMSKADLTGLYPFLIDRTRVIPNGVDTTLEYNPLGVEKRPFILHVGGFTFEKDHESVLEIFMRFLENYPDAVLWLVGDGPRKEQVMTYARNLNISAQVKFVGYIDNPMDYISSADMLILPSKIEGMPGVILEAFYCQIPVVAYDVGGIPEILAPEAGWLIPRGNQEAFAGAMTEVLSNRDVTKLKIAKAFDLVKSNFSLEQITHQFVGLYSTLHGKN